MNDDYYNSSHQYNRQGRGEDYHEYPTDPSRTLESMSQILGLLSIAACFIFPVILPFIFAGVGIMLAIISRGKLEKFHPLAKRGVVLACVGITINLVITAGVAATSYSILTDRRMRKEANELMERMYGYPMDDLLRQLDDIYGTNLTEMAE